MRGADSRRQIARAPFTRTSVPVSFNHSEMNHPARALRRRQDVLLSNRLALPASSPSDAAVKRATETKRRRHNKQDGLHAGKNRVFYPPIISRRGRSCVTIDIKQTSVHLHLVKLMARRGCFFIDRCSRAKED